MTVDAIKDAITGLPESDKASLAAWLNAQTMDDWDREIAQDFSSAGRGTALLQQVEREIAEGHARPIEEGFAERKSRRG